VAKIAGVSAITASRVLNTPELVSAGAQARVQEAVLQTGYVPNLLAGSLASNRSRLVATIVRLSTVRCSPARSKSISATLAQLGYEVMVGLSGYADSREDELLKEILSRRPAGIVLTGVVHSTESRRRLLAAKIPVVETGTSPRRRFGLVVGFSHKEDRPGNRQISRVTRRSSARRGDRRRSACDAARATVFTENAQTLGLTSVPIVQVDAPPPSGAAGKRLRIWLERHRDLDAVVCSSDVLALGILQEAKARKLEVPRQLKIMGFGDLNYAADLEPALTTVSIDGAFDWPTRRPFYRHHHAGKPSAQSVVDVGFSIIRRESA